jgi:hypothetical protein
VLRGSTSPNLQAANWVSESGVQSKPFCTGTEPKGISIDVRLLFLERQANAVFGANK